MAIPRNGVEVFTRFEKKDLKKKKRFAAKYENDWSGWQEGDFFSLHFNILM